MFGLFVLEVLVDTLLLHEPTDKVKIGLAILHAILARLECTLAFIAEIHDAATIEDIFDDLRNSHALIDVAVASVGKQPQRGTQLDLVALIAPCTAGIEEGCDVGRERNAWALRQEQSRAPSSCR